MPKSHPVPATRLNVSLAALPVIATIILGQIATAPNLTPWYSDLAKPSFNPPNWLFAPAWTTLYVLMAYACWRILRLAPHTKGKAVALTLFFLQLGLNAAWTWLFFALHSPRAGLCNIIPQWLLILATIATFYKLDKVAAFCLVPLALWVAYAALLNGAIWFLNN